jgi:hypothetical protein
MRAADAALLQIRKKRDCLHRLAHCKVEREIKNEMR